MKSCLPLFLCTLFLFPSVLKGQDLQGSESFEKEVSVGLFISHFHVFSGVHSEQDFTLVLPSLELNLDYQLAPSWGIGLHTDLVLQSFAVRNNLGDPQIVSERTTPIAPSGVILYSPFSFLTIFGGGGVDISKEETLPLIKVGADLGLEISERLEFTFSSSYDLRFSRYSSLSIGFGLIYSLTQP